MAEGDDDRSSSDRLSKFLEEEEMIGQECRELISSLPREDGWIAHSIYQYQGLWRQARMTQGALRFQKHFEARDSDIVVVTTVKSGTTWLKALLFATLNQKAYPPNAPNHPLLSNSPHLLVPFMELHYRGDNSNY